MMVSSQYGKGGIPQIQMDLQNVTYAPIATSDNQEKKQRKVILSNITTTISPKKLTAWMGPSGSGKTSLISVAANLVAQSDLTDDSIIKVNGEEGRIPKRLVGVVWQDDLLLSNLTVQETIFFSARLKTPQSVSNSEVQQIVDEIIDEVGLSHVRDSLVGGNQNHGVRGVSGGERKRLSVASELVVRPPVLLLDEPTSGLDATTSLSLIKTLKELSTNGHSIVVVIHQPRTSIFNMCDHLLLLSQGETIFDGPTASARAHIEACTTVEKLPPETGIADWLMDTIIEDEKRSETRVLLKHWISEGTPIQQNANVELVENRRPSLIELNKMKKFETTFWTQLVLLVNRSMKQQRGERLTRVAVLLTFSFTFFTGLFWFRLPDDSNRVFERNSLLFFMLIGQSNQSVVGSLTIFQRERALLRRERAKKMYRVLPYFLAKTLNDLSINVLLPCVYGVIAYWVANLRPTAQHFFQFVLAYYLLLSTAQSMGLCLSILIPNPQIALVLAPAITIFFMILAGFYVPVANIHPGIQWASWSSFARYGYQAMVVTEFLGRDVPCATGEVAISVGGGECPLPGEDIISSIGIEGISEEYWFNIGMITLLQVIFRLTAFGLLRRSK